MAYWQLLLCLSNLLYPVGVLSLEQAPLEGGGAERALEECQSLVARFPELVCFPHDVLYEQEQSHYWSARQTDLKPACRLTPTTTEDTSDLMQYLHRHKIDIAITNGGHSTVAGASNLDAGITLDLSSISSISIAADNASVEVGTGAHWLDVYQLLDPKGLTVAGARAGSVGTGGFLLGGGISISATKHGWSCDNLNSIELVLANGSVVNVNQTHHADLLRSLKGGGSNFGIATSFTLRSFPITLLQVAIVRFEWHQISQLMHEVSVFTRKAHEDPNASLDVSMSFETTSNKLFAFLLVTRFGDISQSQILQPFFDIPHSSTSLHEGTPGELAHLVDLSNPKGYRQHRCTMTIQNDAATVLAIAQAFASTVTHESLLKDQAYRPGFLLQPISQAQLGRKGESESSGNMLGLDKEKEPLLLISFEVRWSFPFLDELHVQRLNDLLERCKEIARGRDALHPFIYLNYAAAGQDVFKVLRDQDLLAQLKAIRTKYDQSHYLENHLSYPFKLED